MKSTVRIGLGALLFVAFVVATWALSNNGLQAQPLNQPPPADFTVQVGEVVEPKLSIPVSEMPTGVTTAKLDREINPIKNPGLFSEDMGMTGTNTTIQDVLVNKGVNQGHTPSPIMTFEGQGEFGAVTPPDTNGDVGPNHYVQMVNLSYEIYDKAGNSLIGPLDNNTLWAGQGGRCETDNSGDPVVLYDEMADRWLLTQFAVGGVPEAMCLAVSQTPDPTGAYYLYEFGMPDFPDYPKLGIWPDGYYMGTNTGTPNHYYAHVFDRVNILAGNVAGHQYVADMPNFLMPADSDSVMPPPAGAPGVFYTFYKDGYANHPAGVDRIELYEFDVDWVTPANTTFTTASVLPITAFNYTVCGFFAGDCIPQQGTSQRLSSLSYWPMARMQYRNFGSYAAMVSNFTVDTDGSDHAGIRWFEVRKTGATPWSLYQEGTFAPDAEHRFMGSMAMDGSGNIALGYTLSGNNTMPALAYATRLSTDPLGTLQSEAILYPGGGSQISGADRWGDYSAMNVDPTDNCTFWFTSEYHNVNDTAFDWNTRIGTFRIPGCTGALGATGTLTGLIDNGTTGITGAIAAATNVTGTINATANASGYYTMTLPIGAYDASASAYGYLPSGLLPVTIVSGTVTTQDFTLATASIRTVDGTVTDVNTGWPLYASIDISGSGYPGATIWTDPELGTYSIDLVEGITYTLSVDAWVDGYLTGSSDVYLTADTTEDFALDADAVTCNAPGYDMSYIFVEDFEADDGGFAHGGTADEWEWGSPTAWPNACAEGTNCWGTDLDDNYENSADNWMQSPVITLTGMSGIATTLTWQQAWHIESSSFDHGYAEIRLDGGAWTEMWSHSSGTVTEDWQELSYTFVVSPSENVELRWRFTSDSSVVYPGLYVDFISIPDACNPPADGGLLVGNVYDENTLDALNGAEVANDGGEMAMTFATPNDAVVDDGFFTAFSPSGSHIFTATMSGGYGVDIETLPISNSDTVYWHFELPAADLSATPLSVHVTVDMGDSVTDTLTINNSGGLATDFELHEKDNGSSSAAPVVNEDVVRKVAPSIMRLDDGSVDCAAYKSYTGFEPREVAAACASPAFKPLYGNDIFAPTDMGYAQDIGYISDNFVSFTLNDFPGQTTVGTNTDAYYGMDFDLAATTLYALNDTTGQLGTIDLSTGAFTGLVPCTPPSGSWTGLTIDPSSDDFYASTGTELYSIDPATGDDTLIGTFGGGSSIMIDIAMNPDGDLYGHDMSTDSIYQIDPATGAATLVGATGFDASYAQGMDFDNGDGILYIFLYIGSGANVYGTVDLATGVVTALATDNPTGEFEGAIMLPGSSDVPWLAESPITGTIAGPDSVDIELSFDAGISEITQPGDYFAELVVNNDSPYDSVSIPITMTVLANANAGKLEGTVTGLGYCDATPATLEDAEVVVVNNIGVTTTLMTDAAGYYSFWMDEAVSPVTITVIALNHESGAATGVAISGQVTTTVDFDLRSMQPCVSVTPVQFEETLLLGNVMTTTLDISNMGALATAFELQERDGGYTSVLMATQGVTPIATINAGTSSVRIGDNVFAANLSANSEDVMPKPALRRPDATTMTHSASQAITAANSISCNAGGLHSDNGYLRTFTLDDFGIGGDFNVTAVEMAIEAATGAGGTQPVTVNLYTLNGALSWANLTLIGTVDTAIVDADAGTVVSIPVTGVASAGSTLVVEFFTPDGQTAGHSLFVGSNAAGQTSPSYLAAVDCGATEPTDIATLGFPDMHIVMNVVGDVGSTDMIWLSESPITGTIGIDSSASIDIVFDASVITQTGDYTGTLRVVSDDMVIGVIEIPVTMHVTGDYTIYLPVILKQ